MIQVNDEVQIHVVGLPTRTNLKAGDPIYASDFVPGSERLETLAYASAGGNDRPHSYCSFWYSNVMLAFSLLHMPPRTDKTNEPHAVHCCLVFHNAYFLP